MCHGVAAAVIWPLAAWILLSGLDDLFLLAVWLLGAHRPRVPPPAPDPLPEKRIAIFVPLWHEHAVIRQMLEHNIDAIRYEKYAFFIGVYPNDNETKEAVEEVASRARNVYLCVCPHPGPTSKADCLN
ncbi:MAG: glycosyltransferase, partial [Bryobacteraceae bacterium]